MSLIMLYLMIKKMCLFTDFNNGRVQVITCDGKYGAARGCLVNPNDDIFFHRNIAYVTDYAFNCLIVFDISSGEMFQVHHFGCAMS